MRTLLFPSEIITRDYQIAVFRIQIWDQGVAPVSLWIFVEGIRSFGEANQLSSRLSMSLFRAR